MANAKQYLRRVSLIVTRPGTSGNNPSAFVPGSALDLSDFHIRFQTAQQDEESPNNCTIRVYNLSEDTARRVREEFSEVVLQAGYKDTFGVIFQGTMRQFRMGREDNKTTYLDILAADGDLAYNWAVVKKTLAAGSSIPDRMNAAIQAMTPYGVSPGQIIYDPDTGGILPRGKVLFGYAKAQVRANAQTMGATWNIQNGRVNVIPLTGYLPGEAVVLTSGTGLIGRPEQTQEGIKARCLLNPKIVVGGTVRIDNKSINQTLQHRDAAIPGGQLPFNQWAGIQRFASIAADGLYRVYVAEHRGNTRGQDWYTDIICLTVDPVTQTCKAYG